MIELVKTGVDKKDAAPAHERSRSLLPTCETCRYCGLINAMDKSVTLVCRRYPPKMTANLVMTNHGAQWQTVTGWPGVQKHEWCGCHEKIEPAA